MNGPGDRPVLPVTWGALALIAFVGGCLFAAAAATGAISPVIWIDVGVCMVLAVVFLLIHLLSRTPRVRFSPRGSWVQNCKNGIAVLALACAVLTPPLTGVAKLAGLVDSGSTVVIEGGECKGARLSASTAAGRNAPPLS